LADASVGPVSDPLTGEGSRLRTFAASGSVPLRAPHGAPKGSLPVAGPIVRIQLPPPVSLRTIGPSAAGATVASRIAYQCCCGVWTAALLLRARLLQVRFGRPGRALNRPSWSPVKGSSARVSPIGSATVVRQRFFWIPATDTDIISAQHFWTGGRETAGPGCYDAVAIARAGSQKERPKYPEKSFPDNNS